MELRHIRYFLALAEELNFSRAAEKLHIAQPPLSRQIRELEEEIGARLFHRTNRHVELTNAGKVFLSKAHQILDQVEQACISTRLSSTGREGEFRVGFSGIVHDFMPFLQQYRALHPQVGIILNQMNSSAQIEALLENRIDFGLPTIPVKSNKIVVQPFKKVKMMAVLPEKHRLADKPSVSIHDLADEPFIMTSKSAGSIYYEKLMSVFQHAQFTPNVTIQANNLQTVMELVAGGLGVTLAPSPLHPMSGITKRQVDDMDIFIEASIAWRKDNHSEILKQFLDFLFKYHQDVVATMDKTE